MENLWCFAWQLFDRTSLYSCFWIIYKLVATCSKLTKSFINNFLGCFTLVNFELICSCSKVWQLKQIKQTKAIWRKHTEVVHTEDGRLLFYSDFCNEFFPFKLNSNHSSLTTIVYINFVEIKFLRNDVIINSFMTDVPIIGTSVMESIKVK